MGEGVWVVVVGGVTGEREIEAVVIFQKCLVLSLPSSIFYF